MAPKVWYFQYEDLRHTAPNYERLFGSINTIMKDLFERDTSQRHLEIVRTVPAPTNLGAAALVRCGDGKHVFDQVCKNIFYIAKKANPGDVVFLVLSAHGNKAAIHLGWPNAVALKPEYVREAFFAAQHKTSQETDKELDPITVVLILNSCSAGGTEDSTESSLPGLLCQLQANTNLFLDCSRKQIGQDWVRWALVRADYGQLAPMKQLLLPVLFDEFKKEKSL
jgi:hypothetical protein